MYLCTNITSKVTLHTDTKTSKKCQKTTVHFSHLQFRKQQSSLCLPGKVSIHFGLMAEAADI